MDKECIICLDNLLSEKCFTLIECIHTFHEKCLNEWYLENKSCPLCRIKINIEEEKVDTSMDEELAKKLSYDSSFSLPPKKKIIKNIYKTKNGIRYKYQNFVFPEHIDFVKDKIIYLDIKYSKLLKQTKTKINTKMLLLKKTNYMYTFYIKDRVTNNTIDLRYYIDNDFIFIGN